ncbi:MAG: hypothetical protein MZW92_56295 [Comamonadaceae bacterium]|nr:hypothetical protein [Comamonadaceae bacterium]
MNFSFVEERWERELAGNADPIRVLNPIAAPLAVMRSSLIGSLVAVLRTTWRARPARVRVFEIGRVLPARRRRPDGPLTVAGVRQPLRAGRAGLRPGRRRCSGAQASAAVDFFDVKGDVEALLAPRRAGLRRRRRTRRCTRAAARASSSTAAPIGCVGELHPQLAPGATSCRRRRCCSSSMLRRAARRAPLPRVRAGAAPAAGAGATSRWCVRRGGRRTTR